MKGRESGREGELEGEGEREGGDESFIHPTTFAISCEATSRTVASSGKEMR